MTVKLKSVMLYPYSKIYSFYSSYDTKFWMNVVLPERSVIVCDCCTRIVLTVLKHFYITRAFPSLETTNDSINDMLQYKERVLKSGETNSYYNDCCCWGMFISLIWEY